MEENIVEKAYADLERRKAEVAAGAVPEVAAGSGQMGRLVTDPEPGPGEEERGRAMRMVETQESYQAESRETAASEFDAPEFAALFAADLEPEPIRFTVGGRECVVWLLPLDDENLKHYRTAGVKTKIVRDDDGKARMEATDFDAVARERYLVSRTMVDYELWEKLRGRDDWQMIRPPEGIRRQLHRWYIHVDEKFRCTPKFWEWLVRECERVNGLTENLSGNSDGASRS